MPLQQKQGETIREFKELRAELGISYQQITEITEDNGESISLATVKRVFAQGAEDQRFRPETLNAIGKVLFDEKIRQQESSPSHEVEALNSLLAYNRLAIENLEKENSQLKEDYEKKLDYIKGESVQKQQQIEMLTVQNGDLTKQAKKKDFWVGFLTIALVLTLAIIIAALVVDRLDPYLGYFWRNMAAVLGGDEGSGIGLDGAGGLMVAAWRSFR